jgi:transposase
MIVIGTDTHKRTHTCGAVFAGTGQLADELTAAAREPGFMELLDWGRGLDEERIWAIEDCRHVSGFLVASGERVVRVPPKLMGQGRRGERTAGKSDPIDALDRMVWLDRVARKLARAEQGARVRVARELVTEIRRRTRRATELEREIGALVKAQAPQLLELEGCGPLTAAKLIAETAGARRLPSDAKFARLAGVAPIPASSGNRVRHRLDRGGNRQLNCALHRIAVTQGRCHAPAREYLAKKQAEGKTRIEALRCLKRHLARRVWKLLVNPEREISMSTVDTQRGKLTPQFAVAA